MTYIKKGISTMERKKRSERRTLLNKTNNPSYKGLNAGEKSALWKGGISRCYSRRIKPRNFCECCKSKENIIIHHIDNNPQNNELSNLQTVCRKCHAKIHGYGGKYGKGKKRYELVDYYCAVCGKKKTARSNLNRKFCSQKCYHKFYGRQLND